MARGLKLRYRNLLAGVKRHDVKDTTVQTPFSKTRRVMRTDDRKIQCGAAEPLNSDASALSLSHSRCADP